MQSPEPHITVSLNGEEFEAFMSFGLLDELTRIIQDPARIASVSVDPELREAVLASSLATRKRSGKIEKAIDLDDADISIEDVERVLDWAMKHTLSFFIRSMKKVAEITELNKAELGGLVSSLVGSESSALKTP